MFDSHICQARVEEVVQELLSEVRIIGNNLCRGQTIDKVSSSFASGHREDQFSTLPVLSYFLSGSFTEGLGGIVRKKSQ